MIKEFMISSLRTIMETELSNPISGNINHLVVRLGNGTKTIIRIRQLQ